MPDLLKNLDYYYLLQADDPEPPLSRHEFAHRFYKCYAGGKRHTHWWWATCKISCRKNDDYLQKIPKRDRWVVEDSDKPEIFWGLLAKEVIQFIRVFLYHLISLGGPVAFFIFWIKTGHSSDLQDASIPMMVAVGLITPLVSCYLQVLGRSP
jgi:hypothetical protein